MTAEKIQISVPGSVGQSIPGQQWVWLARIRKPQGRKGEVLAEILTDYPEKFAERKRIWLLTEAGSAKESANETTLDSFFLHKGGRVDAVLHLGCSQSIEAAELLRDQIVAIPYADRAPLGEDEAYIGDLIDCELYDTASEPATLIGTIGGVDKDAGPVHLIVVKAASNGQEILIPFAKAYLRKIDTAAKRVEMSLPEGLVEVQL
jgi:16S rRNA processing protein RimM